MKSLGVRRFKRTLVRGSKREYETKKMDRAALSAVFSWDKDLVMGINALPSTVPAGESIWISDKEATWKVLDLTFGWPLSHSCCQCGWCLDRSVIASAGQKDPLATVPRVF